MTLATACAAFAGAHSASLPRSSPRSIAPSPASYRLRIECNGPIIALWAAVQPTKSLILGPSGLRPLDLYTIRKLSERRTRLSNDTIFDNVAPNAKFITHTHDIYIQLGLVTRRSSSVPRGWRLDPRNLKPTRTQTDLEVSALGTGALGDLLAAPES